jgi:hypothetical protein
LRLNNLQAKFAQRSETGAFCGLIHQNFKFITICLLKKKENFFSRMYFPSDYKGRFVTSAGGGGCTKK